MAEFLKSIGLAVAACELPEPTFLTGIAIRGEFLLIDETRLLNPGDILHEAGHLALLPAADRVSATAPLEAEGGFEMAAIAWSYAAACHLNVPLEILFHSNGYKGASQSLIDNFTGGRYVGVPLLEWTGLTYTGARAVEAGVAPYPTMRGWVRP